MKPKSTVIAASSSKVVSKQIPTPSNIKTTVHQKKEVKIYKMTPATPVTAGPSNKKVTIQMKDSPMVVRPQQTGKFVINKHNANLQGDYCSNILTKRLQLKILCHFRGT